jgi:hypothetical protein
LRAVAVAVRRCQVRIVCPADSISATIATPPQVRTTSSALALMTITVVVSVALTNP